MKISVIISIYNKEKYIEKCLESLFRQTYKSYEIIVVDDGSSDNSKLKCQNLKLQLKIKNLRLFKQKHKGPAIARNLGAEQAKGEILVFVDGDMYFDKNFLKALIRPIVSGQARGAFSTEEKVANWENVWARCWNYNLNLPNKKRINPFRTDQVKDFRAILKKEFIKVGGFDNTGYTDTWTLSEKLNYKPKAVKAYYYHYNPSTLKEVFMQAKWAAKRKYKFGVLGRLIALLRANPFFSILIGISKAVYKKEPGFIIFKIIYDLGSIAGIIGYMLNKKVYYI